jgi:hypothetical protein
MESHAGIVGKPTDILYILNVIRYKTTRTPSFFAAAKPSVTFSDT